MAHENSSWLCAWCATSRFYPKTMETDRSDGPVAVGAFGVFENLSGHDEGRQMRVGSAGNHCGRVKRAASPFGPTTRRMDPGDFVRPDVQIGRMGELWVAQ